jgi:hypothetical protein
MIKKLFIYIYAVMFIMLLTSCAVADGVDKMMYPEFYVDHKAYLVNATHYDVEVKMIDIYQQKLVQHHFIQPKARGAKNKKFSPWVVPITIRLGTYRIMVFLPDGRHNVYQSFMLYEADFNDNRSPVWIVTETANKRIKVVQRLYKEKE